MLLLDNRQTKFQKLGWWVENCKAKLSEDPDFCNGVKFIAGHYPFGLHKNLKTGDVKYTVLLRDPIEQAGF